MSHLLCLTERTFNTFIYHKEKEESVNLEKGKEGLMGNSRFRFSDMMPNAWFYKLKDMGKGKNQGNRKKKQQSSSAEATESSKPKQIQQCNPRKSYYFTRELTPTDRIYTSPAPNSQVSSEALVPEPPRKSSKQKPKRRTPKLVNSSVSAGSNCRATLESVWTKSDSPPESSSSPVDSSAESEFPEPEFRTDRVLAIETFDETDLSANSCGCRVSSNVQDIVIDVDKNSIARKDDKLNGYDSFSELELPPIITKPAKFNDLLNDAKKGEKPRSRIARNEEANSQKALKVKVMKEDTASIKEQRSTPVPVRRFSVSSPGVKLRIHSPRIGFGSRKSQGHGRRNVSSGSSSRRSLSGSFAVIKSSYNPQRDFRESMVEMIVENNIRASKDLEDLLACYLSLNSDEYHDLIIKVFKQIWFDLTDTQ